MNRVAVLSLLLCAVLLAQRVPAAGAQAAGMPAQSAEVCQDVQNGNFTCSDQYSWGKCNEEFMDGFCDLTCERCCTDEVPPSPENYTCADQQKFGACEKVWMQKHNWCQLTCNRCHAAGYAIPPSSLPSATPDEDTSVDGAAGGVTTAAAPAPGSPNPPSTDVAADTEEVTAGADKAAEDAPEAPSGETPLTDAQKAEIAAGGTMEPDNKNLSWIAGIVVAVVVVGVFMGGVVIYLQHQKHKRFQTLEDTEVAMSARGF